MGASASTISKKQKQNATEKCAGIVNDTAYMDKLFHETASAQSAASKAANRINNKTKISNTNLLAYFRNCPDETLSEICSNQEVLINAHRVTTESISKRNQKSKKKDTKKMKMQEQISKAEFRLLLVNLYIVSTLWKVFMKADTQNRDRRLSKQEFVDGKDIFAEEDGFEFVKDLTSDEWEKVFERIDHDGNSYLSFAEVCNYFIEFLEHSDEAEFFEEAEEEVLYFESVTAAVDKVEEEEKHAVLLAAEISKIRSKASVRRASIKDEMSDLISKIKRRTSFLQAVEERKQNILNGKKDTSYPVP